MANLEDVGEIDINDPVEALFVEAIRLYRRKSQDYGQAWRSQGYLGNVARVLSKSARLKNMLWREDPLRGSGESIEDTLLDLINISAFAVINFRENNRWGK